MKNILLYTSMLLLSTATLFAQVDRSKRPEAGPARAPEIGNYESFTLKNGLKVFVVENRKLPRVSMSLIFDLDPILEGEKAGYVSMAGDLLGRGTTTRTKEAFDREVDFMGASINTSASSISASGLSKYTEKLMMLMADVAQNPAFSQEEFDKALEQLLSGLKANQDDPGAIMSNVYGALIYGKNHPYGEIVTEATATNFTLQDCKNYHATYIKPNVGYLAIVGDINVKQAKKLVTKYFGKWASGTVPKHTYSLPEGLNKNMIAFVDRQASVQSVIQIGNPIVLKPGAQDIEAMRIMNQILGSGSMGRLYNNLREDKGYTYGAYSNFGVDPLVSNFSASAQVRNEVTAAAVKEFLYELDKIRKGEVTDEEMQKAKASLSGSFGRSLESPATIASFALNIARYNLPADYYKNYLKRVDAVTKDDVKRAAINFINSDKLLIAIVGKGQQVAPTLEEIAPLAYFDIYAEKTEAPSFLTMPEGVTANDVVENYIKAIGGKDKLSKITAMSSEMTAEMEGLPAPLEIVIGVRVPDYYIVSQSIPGMFSQKQIYEKGKAKSVGMQNADITGDELEDMKFKASVVFEELMYFTDKFTVTLEGQNKIGGIDVYQLLVVDAKGKEKREYYDVTTGLKVREEESEDTPKGPIVAVAQFMDYKDFGGILFPSQFTQEAGPQKLVITIKDVKYNKDVPVSLFK